jgi:hypothetical protein
LASNRNLPTEFIETLKLRSNKNLEKQNETGVLELLKAMAKIVLAWEPEETTTTVPTTVNTGSSTVTQSTPEITTPTTTNPSSTTESTTLGASSLSVHIFLLLFVIIISLLK